MAATDRFQFFMDGAVDWVRRRPGQPDALLRVGLSQSNYHWARRIGDAASFPLEEIAADAAWCGALCVTAAQCGLKVGFTPDGSQFDDATPALGAPTPQFSKDILTVHVPLGVATLIEIAKLSEERVVSDGLHMLQIYVGDQRRRKLVVADLHYELGRAPVIEQDSQYSLPFDDYRQAAALAF